MNSPEDAAHLDPGGAKSGALDESKPIINDPALTAVIDAWPTLPNVIRAGILAMIRAASA